MRSTVLASLLSTIRAISVSIMATTATCDGKNCGLAVGTMIVAAFYTLYKLRTSLIQGIGRAFGDLGAAQAEGAGRQDIDIDFRKTGLAIAVLAVPLFGLYWYFSESFGGAILLTIMMVILGFLFAAVAGYLVGLLGSSNNPISGLTLSTWLCQLKRCTPEAPRS